MLESLLLAGLVVAHGLVHIGFVSPRPPATAEGPRWPFEVGRSWLIRAVGGQPEVGRVLALAMVPLIVAAFALGAIAALGVAPALWAPSIAIGSIASLVLLIVFFDPWLVVGIGIDVVLLWATVVGSVPSSSRLA